jgi:hypothetical protein
MKLSYLLIFTLVLAACDNSGNSNDQTGKSRSDSLMDEVMEGHNIGMAKMNRISMAEKEVQQTLDSISKLSANLQKNSLSYKMQLDSMLDRLKFADYAMNRWMNEFNMDSFSNNEEERVEYLESEKEKIFKVKDTMINSLQAADSLLAQKNK